MSEQKDLSRRDFLMAAGAAGVGSLLSGRGLFAESQTQPATTQAATTAASAPVKFDMPTRTFGKTGAKVPILALGGIFDIAANQIILKQALDWGVSYWDTANGYVGGKSEIGIGKYFQKRPEDRGKVFLVTKSVEQTADGIQGHFDLSLERMQTDYVDMMFLHDVKDPAELTDDIRAWADKAKSSGKIKFFGFSTHARMATCLAAAAKLGWIDGIMTTYNFQAMQEAELQAAVDACAKAGIGLTAMKTQGRGPRKGQGPQEPVDMLEKLMDTGLTIEQAKLKAVWANPNIVSICSQMSNLTILKANVEAACGGKGLSAEQAGMLQQFAMDTCDQYCIACGRCEALTGGLPVSDVMRSLMYRNSYSDHELAVHTYKSLPADIRDRLAGADYSQAQARCPRRLPIAELMSHARDLLA